MSDIEHPKSTVNRLIAQNKILDVTIFEPNYQHEYVQIGNKNVFSCSIDIMYKGTQKTIKSEEYLSKKDCEKDVFEQILLLLTKKRRASRSNEIDKPNKFNKLDDFDKTDKTNITNITNKATKVTKANKANRVNRVNRVNKVNKINETLTTTMTIADILNFCEVCNDKLFIIIDLENISKVDINSIALAIDSNPQLAQKHMRIIKIAGFCSSVKSSADIIIRSNRKDAVDHYISYLIGVIETKSHESSLIYVITRDKFGSCLQDFCNNVIHCSDVIDFIQCVSK